MMHNSGDVKQRRTDLLPLGRLFRDKKDNHSLVEYEKRTRHSHRNSNPDQQMILAESLYDPEAQVASTSRLSLSCLSDLQHDRFAQAYFDAFAERLPPESGHLIKLWIRVCRIRWPDNVTMETGIRRMTLTDMHELGRRARTILDRCTSDQNIQRILPPALHDRFLLLLQTQELDVTLELFDPLLEAIREPVQVAFASFLLSPFFLKYQIDIMTKGHISLSDVLFYDGILFYFLEFMEQEGMRKYADFLLIIHSYRNAEAGQVDSLLIWRKFFAKQPDSQCPDRAAYCLNFSDHVCSQVRDKMRNQQQQCFDLPARLLHQYLQKTYFRQFLESQEYFDVTTELITRFQRMQFDDFAGNDQRCLSMDQVSPAESTASDAITDMPSSQTDHNTGVTVGHEKQSDEANIWARSCPGLQQILHVDRYGRVISDLEPDPDKSQERSNISKSIRNFVARSVSNQDSSQAMAWKAAQAIIDDIVNVTQAFT